MTHGQLEAASPALVVYGAGGFAREVAWLAESCADSGPVGAMIDDDPARHGSLVNGIPVYGLDQARAAFPSARMTIGIGAPRLREAVAARASAAGFQFVTLIHPRVERSRWIEVGEGVVICVGNILTTNIRIGRHVQINLDCTVGHDVVLGDFVTLAPGVNVSGRVRIGARAYIGTNASIINGDADAPLVIGDDAVVGAAACVTRNVAPGTTVVGVPAKPRS
jgi:sugar O-acyltransferase (sialic acid O-acetyltransferase NeuD family)